MSETAAAPSPTGPDPARAERFARALRNPLKLRTYFAAKLPLALFAGLRVRGLTTRRCDVAVPYGWRTTNPFRSTYFAAQTMAAELSTGALVMLAANSAPAPVSMLVVTLSATFGKKASETLVFTCEDGDAAFDAVRRTLETGEGVTVEMTSVGRLPDGTEAARFVFTWSVKKKSPKG